jgi:prolyl-tRNA synthetase
MRLSRSYLSTLRETPSGAECASHQLLLKAGLIVAHAAGVYSYTPLLWRSMRRLMAIVSEEMDGAGAHEMLMPVLQPEELWERSGRLEQYGGLLFRLHDRREARFALGPTHEEVVTDLVGRTVSSYRQLPLTLYHQGVKFRDEARPQFGLVRAREFLMKDAYSFDADAEGLEASYAAMRAAYGRILERCELEHAFVEAEVGEIGGSSSEEVVVLAAGGTEELLRCTNADCAVAEWAETAHARPEPVVAGEGLSMVEAPTPGVTTIEQLRAAFPDVPLGRMVKSLLFRVTTDPAREPEAVLALVGAAHAVSEAKLLRALGAQAATLAEPEDVRAVTGAEVGFAGPVCLPAARRVRVVADEGLRGLGDTLCGMNRTGYHALHVELGRDCPEPEYHDLRLAATGDRCARCGAELASVRGFEVGHLFKLGTKYSAAMGARFLDATGQERPFEMGCYGLGLSRLIAATIEQRHDERGIVWPEALAPYGVHVVLLSPDRPEAVEVADHICEELAAAGCEALYDDRTEVRAGAKFADADLLGMPWRLNVGRGAARGTVELVERATGTSTEMAVAEAVARLAGDAGSPGRQEGTR